MNTYFSLAVIIASIYLVRVLPLLFLRKDIHNRWVRSFFFYVPYVTLAVMTFPSILHSADAVWQGLAALIVGLIAAWITGEMFTVAILCCITVFLTGLLF